MIAVDTSALMALLLDEPGAETIADILANDADVSIPAVTLAEARIVAARRGLALEMADLTEGLGFDVEAVTGDTAKRVADAYALWGKAIHPAALNFGDCFAYVTAMSRSAPLLYVGENFSRTDVQGAMARSTSGRAFALCLVLVSSSSGTCVAVRGVFPDRAIALLLEA